MSLLSEDLKKLKQGGSAAKEVTDSWAKKQAERTAPAKVNAERRMKIETPLEKVQKIVSLSGKSATEQQRPYPETVVNQQREDSFRALLNDAKNGTKKDTPKTLEEWAQKSAVPTLPTQGKGFTVEELLPESEQPSFWKDNLRAGALGAVKGYVSTLDFLTPDSATSKSMQDMFDYYRSLGDRASEMTAKRNENYGAVGVYGGKLVQTMTQMVPDLLIAAATGGTSAAATGAKTVKSVLGSIAKNPSFWNSMAQTVGVNYDEAKSEGATDFEAFATAIIGSALSSGVEAFTGFENIPKSTNGILGWVKSALEEGGEEVVQGVIENLTAKAIYDKSAPWYSTTDTNAIVNPSKMAEEFLLGAAAGGIMGAPYAAAEAIGRRKQSALPGNETAAPTNKKKVTFDDILNMGKEKTATQSEAVDIAQAVENVPVAGVVTPKVTDVTPAPVMQQGSKTEVPAVDDGNVFEFNKEPRKNNLKTVFDDKRRSAQWKAATKIMDTLSNVTGVRFVVEENSPFADGWYDPVTRTAHINKNSEKPFSWVVSHEFGHDLKVNDRATWDSLKQWARNDLDLAQYSKYKTDLLARYDEIGADVLGFDYKKMTNDQVDDLVMEEVISDLVAEVMQDPETIRRIAAQDLTLAEKIITYLDEFIKKIADALGYSDPEVRALVNNFEEVKGVYQAYLENTAKKGSQSEGLEGDTKHKIIALPDGKKYVQADRQVIFSSDPNRWSAELETYINEKIINGQEIILPTEDGELLKITNDSAWKLSDKTGLNEEEFARKINAVTHIDELAKISRYKKSKEDIEQKHKNKRFKADTFDYRNVFFRDFDGEYYLIPISVGVNSDGKTVYSIGKMKKRRFPVVIGSSGKSGAQTGRPSVYSISNSSENVNPKYSISYDSSGKQFAEGQMERDSEYLELAKDPVKNEARLRELVDEAAQANGYNVNGYHGTGADFNIFTEESIGKRNVWGKGFYFGTSKAIADDYASLRQSKGGKYRIVNAILKMENPFVPHKSSFGTAEEILDRWFPDMWKTSRGLGIGYIEGKLDNSPLDLLQFIAEHNNIEVRDVLREYGYDSVKDGGELVVFDSNQVKSADLVTYDDNGNVIPLSERFNTEKTDIRYSVSRRAKAEEAVAKYRETGDVRDLPPVAWAKTFKRDANAKGQYLDNQLANLEYDLQYADEASKAQIEGAIAKLREKIQKASADTVAAGELADILDNIALSRNYELAPIIDSLSDVDKGLKIKSGNYNFNDFYRNFERFFGKHFDVVRPLLDDFDAAKGDYARAQVERLADMRQYVVEELGIKPNSKESKAVQWIAEGMRNPFTKQEIAEVTKAAQETAREKGLDFKQTRALKKSLRVDYTEAMLRAEFGEERAEAILKAEKWFRTQYDELIEEINKTQRMIYPNNPEKLIPKRKDYMRHFREMETGFRGLMNLAETDNNISPSLVMTSEFTKPKEKWASIKQVRQGTSTDEGAIEGFIDYLPQAAYATHINPFIDRFRGLARDIAELKAKTDNGNANAFIKYLTNFTNNIAGKSAPIDRAIVDAFGSNGRTFIKALNWFNNRVKSNAVLSNVSSVSKQVMNIPNGVELLNNPANILQGISNTIKGYAKNQDVADNYKKSDFLTERFLDKSYSKLEKNGLSKSAQWLLSAGDEFGTRSIWNAAYKEGQELYEAGEITETPERYADVLTRRAVAGRGVGEIPLMYQSQIGKLIMPFQIEISNTWNVKRDVLTDKSKTPLNRATREGLAYLATFALGSALEALVGSRGGFDPLNDIIKGIMQGWKEEEDEDAFSKILAAGKRTAQNVSGGFIGSRPLGWLVGSFLEVIDDDWDTKFFNDSLFKSQGVNVPAVQSVQKSLKDFAKGDWVGGIAEAASSFLLPFGGKQLDKTIRGVADYLHGGKYQNDIYKEWSTGERGDKYYDIPQTAGNFVKSALFGPSAIQNNSDYWEEKKLRGYASEEQKRAEAKATREFVKNYNKNHPNSEVENLYNEVKDFSVYPFESVDASREYTHEGKKVTFFLLPAEQKLYQEMQDKLMQENYDRIIGTAQYKNSNADEKREILKDARSEAKETVNEIIKNDHLYKDNKAYGRLVSNSSHTKRLEKDYTNAAGYAKHTKASNISNYANALKNGGKLMPAVAQKLQAELDKKQNVTSLDEELYRLDKNGFGVETTNSIDSLLEFKKGGVPYKINVPNGRLFELYADVDREVRRALEGVIKTSTYKNASIIDKQDMLKDAKKKTRDRIEAGLKSKYGYSADGDFSKATRMK